MDLFSPRFVAFDTATIAHAADNTHNEDVKRLLQLVQDGLWIPYLTNHHLEEIACYEDNAAFERRLDFIAKLKTVACLKLNHEGSNVGSSMELQELEMQCLLARPQSTHAEIIRIVGPKVRSGFSTGRQLIQENHQWWRFFRQHFSEETKRHKADVANVCHFESIDGRQRLPRPGSLKTTLTKESAAAHFAQQSHWLEEQIKTHGDCRYIDPKAAAQKTMSEAYHETISDIEAGGDFIEAGMKRLGIERSRLPKNPRIEDVGDEGVFVAQLNVHARRLRVTKDKLLNAVKKEQLPSWVIWKFLDRRTKSLPKAEIGNVNDKSIACFGPYLDLLNLDKRMIDFFRQAKGKNPLCESVHRKLPTKSGLPGLLDAMTLNQS